MQLKKLIQVIIFTLLIIVSCSGRNHLILDPKPEAQAFTKEEGGSQNISSNKIAQEPQLPPAPPSAPPQGEKTSAALGVEVQSSGTGEKSEVQEGEKNLPEELVPSPSLTSTATISTTPLLTEELPPSPEEESPTPAETTPPSPEGKALQPEKPAPPSLEGEELVFNFDNADINEVISTIGDLLGINYIAPPGLAGVVNIHTKGKIARKDLFSVLETILKINNFTIIKKGELYQIIPLQTAKQEYTPLQIGMKKEGLPLTDTFLIQIVPLKYVSATEIGKVIQPLVAQTGTITPKDNLLIIMDTSANINKLLTLIELFDVDVFDQVHMQLYEVKKADVEEMAADLDTIFQAIMPPTEGPRAGGITFVPISRINMLMAVSSNDKVLEKAIGWAQKLDTEVSEAAVKVFVYFVQNGKALDISNVLNQIFLGQAPQQTTMFQSKLRETTKSLTQPSQTQTRQSRAQQQRLRRQTQTQPTQAQTQQMQPQVRPTTLPQGQRLQMIQPSALLKGEVQIVVDEVTNALIIMATERDYRVIEKTLKKLDIYPKQVLIEVLIAEIRLDDELKMGVEWEYLNTAKGGSYTVDVSGAADLATEITSGLMYAIDKTGRYTGALRALASKDKVNILSSPHIIASDNKEAEIDVTEEIPIVSGQVTTTSAQPVITQTTEYRDTGIILKVTPHINDKGLVILDVSQEVSEQSSRVATGSSNPIFLKRSAVTSMVVQNAQTVIIGGLIKESLSKGKSGVPLLSRIPLVGSLFGLHTNTANRSELMLLLTPHVISSIEEADLITKEFQHKLEILKGKKKEEKL